MNLKKTKILIVDLGILGIPVGQAIANDFQEVLYWTPWVRSFTTPFELHIGEGIPGITRVDSYHDAKREILADDGIIYFCDVGQGDMQDELRREGARVVGAGNSGELEMDREKAKKVLKERGLSTPKYGIVTGIDALEKILREKKDLYIKLNTEDRGIMETFHHESWEMSRGIFYKLAYDLKCFRDTTKFLWEEPWEGIEVGQDTWVVNGEYFSESLYGIELKGDGYICRHLKADEFPKAIKKINESMAPVERKYKTSGAISSEIRVGPQGAYYGDFTRRQGNPPTACITAIYKNLAQIIAGIADGVEVKPEWNAKYAAELSVEVPGAEQEAVAMPLEESDFSKIKIRAACKIGKMYYNIPLQGVGNVVVKAVGLGDDKDEAEANALESAAGFAKKCKGASFNRNTFEDLEEEIKKGAKYGLSL